MGAVPMRFTENRGSARSAKVNFQKQQMQDHSERLIHPKYRADIDGLRAVAVLSVVVFHAFPDFLKGGFIGVDIFFVISGFLISTIIYENLDSNRFSFVEFYSRRIKRIFPALVIVLAVCFAVGWFELPAEEFKQLAKHIAGGAGFGANYVLLGESGYFDTAAQTKPLLHLWSLGIEEQFYIVWPLLLWLAWKRRFNRFSLALLVAGVSFSLNLRLLLQEQPDVAKMYYAAETRFWELLTGSILAYVSLNKPFRKIRYRIESWLYNGGLGTTWLNDMQALLGTSLLVVGLLVISKDKAYPGWWGFLPTVGAALIISAESPAWINRHILSSRLLVWLGLVSYPFYLWHWPLLSFARIMESDTPSASVRVDAVLIALVLAWLTRQCIETPLRLRGQTRFTVPVLLALMLVVGGAGYDGFINEGFPSRYGKVALKREIGRYECDDRKKDSGCVFGNLGSGKLVIVWGDSHAEHLTRALNQSLGDKYRFQSVTDGSCFMGEKVLFPDVGNKKDCNAAIEKLKSLRGQKIFAVIRSQRWHGYGNYDEKLVRSAVQDTVSAFGLKPEKYIVVGSTADVDFDCEVHNFYSRTPADKKQCKTFEDIKAYNRLFISTTRAMSLPPNMHFVYPYEKICRNDSCAVISGNISYYSDTHHLSKDGAMLVMPEISEALAR